MIDMRHPKSTKYRLVPIVALLAVLPAPSVAVGAESSSQHPQMIDLSSDSQRHVVIAQGKKNLYHGHPTTLLLPDGKTMFCAWNYDHGGLCGPMKRSDDGGQTWSELLKTPKSWSQVRRCPSIYRLVDPKGTSRLFVFAGQGPDGTMHQAYSEDDGKTWSEMTSNGLTSVMPFCTIVPIDGGKRLLGMTNIRRPGEVSEEKSNVVAQSVSSDGGSTWSPWRIVHDLPGLKPAEPCIVRSPSANQLLCLLRENEKHIALYSVSDDDGATWSAPEPLPLGLHGDRHVAHYAGDGRLVVCFRDTGDTSPTKDHFVAWVGRYEDIAGGRPGQYRIKLLHSYAGRDCGGNNGLECLPDDTLVATCHVKYRPGTEKPSIISVRFRLSEIDNLAKLDAAPGGDSALELRKQD
jgi:hypothetical protein